MSRTHPDILAFIDRHFGGLDWQRGRKPFPMPAHLIDYNKGETTMAFNIPGAIGPILMQLIALVPSLINQAELAFSGDPGNGPAKKQFVMDSVKGLIAMQQSIKPDLLTDAQEDAIIDVINKQVEAVVAIFNTIKLFKAPKPPTV